MKKHILKPLCMIAFVFSQGVIFAQSIDSLTLDFSDYTTNNSFYSKLSTLHLKKGDFVTVKIKNINPYRYNILVTAKNDTLKAGTEPALFTEFMDVSKLGTIAGNISSLIANVSQASKDSTSPTNKLNKQNPEKYSANSNLQKNTNDYKIIDSIKSRITEQMGSIESKYNQISDCYTQSISTVYNTQVDYFNKTTSVACFKKESCDCMEKNQKDAIQQLIKTKAQLLQNIDKLSNLKGISEADAKNLKGTLNSKTYSYHYLNNIYLKTYSNFLIAENTDLLSTYYSFPIQVQGDKLELKIDITPKGSDSGKKDDKKKDDTTGKNTNTNNVSNQSPVTININTDKSSPKKDTTGAGESGDDNSYSADELKVVMPAATKEYHLNYKYRTSNCFYGFSSGFFVDGLRDDNYSNKPTDASDPNTDYKLIAEDQKKFGKFGIMATVNGGRYFGYKTSWFGQLFAGPGLTVETKLQPRLLIGGGFGSGGQNKFSINGGLAIGQVKKLSGIFDVNTSYTVPQTDLYYTTNSANWFISINYVFDFRK